MPEITHLWKAYQGRNVVSDFSFTFPEKGLYLLMGPSGCGKTTLLRLLAGIERPDKGSVTGFERTSVCFQEYRLFPQLSAMDNVVLPVFRHPEEWHRAKAAELLRRLGLDDQAQGLKPGALSGGMKQRVSLARALCAEVPVLLLDEPLKELDAALRGTGREMIREAAAHRLVLMTIHDPREAEGLEARVL